MAFAQYLLMAGRIGSFWLDGAKRETVDWKKVHRINIVMLTSLPGELLAAC